MFHSLPAAWLAVFSAMAAASAAVAQPAPASAPAIPRYQSALEGYQAFADEKPIPWKEANDTAHRRGGWRAYAKEAAEPSSEAGSAGEAAPANPHAGHHRHDPEPSKEQQP
jgi:hypothetical protein